MLMNYSLDKRVQGTVRKSSSSLQVLLCLCRSLMVYKLVLVSGLTSFENMRFNNSNNKISTREVPCIDASQFQPNTHYYHTHSSEKNQKMCNHFYETPVLIENALSEKNCDLACDVIMRDLGSNVIDLQRKLKQKDGKVVTDIAKCRLIEAFDNMMQSNHEKSYFCFCEGLLDQWEGADSEVSRIKELFNASKEKLFENSMDEENLFDFFPDNIQPSECVVVAGEGATSTLHRDPYSWTGTSLCLEGTKVWRFVAPPLSNIGTDSGISLVDESLQSYRLPSVAWDDDLYLSAGWQSDFSLYESRDGSIPSAIDFANLEENDPHKKLDQLLEIASDMSMLKPSQSFPHFLDKEGTIPTTLWTVVQKPGDILIIPAFWWHQTYALEPSLAIASQRSGQQRDTKRVIRHILDTIGYSAVTVPLPESLQSLMNGDERTFSSSISQQELVEDLVQYLSSI